MDIKYSTENCGLFSSSFLLISLVCLILLTACGGGGGGGEESHSGQNTDTTAVTDDRSLGVIPVAGTRTILEDFNRVQATSWSAWGSDSGASGSVTSSSDGYEGTRGLSFNYSFTCPTSGPCGEYAAAIFRLPNPVSAGAAVTFMAKSAPNIQLGIRVIDQSGQTLQYTISRPLEGNDPGAWYKVIVPLTTPSSYWGGASNGVVQGQINAIWIIAAKPHAYPTTGTIALDNLAVVSNINGEYLIDLATAALLPVTSGTEALGSRIGVAYNWANVGRTFPSVRAAGISFIRVDLFWSWIETSLGIYDFSIFDRLVSDAEAHGLGVLFILDYGNRFYNHKTPNGVAAFANFAGAAAAHFAGRNVRFEVWNEPDTEMFWGISPNYIQEYAALCQTAIASIRNANPAAQVTTGGISWFNFNYLVPMLAAGAADQADSIGVHGYRRGIPETMAGEVFTANWKIQQTLGRSLPIWNTEWGYSVGTIPGDGHSATFRKRQAVLLARQMLTQWMLNIPVAVWYDLIDDGTDPNNTLHNYGLFDAAYNEKPALQALRTLTSQANGRTNKGLIENAPPGLHIIKLESQADIVFVAWNSLIGSEMALNIPTAGSPVVKNYLGNVITATVSGNNITFGLRETDGPIYIQYRK